MAENGIKREQNGSLGTIGTIVVPFIVYYGINLITTVLLTALVDMCIQTVGGGWERVLTEQQATVRAVIGGLAMMSGILPLFSAFRQEVYNSNNCNNNVSFKKLFLIITLAFASSISLNILFIVFHLTESSEAYSQVAAHQYAVILPVGLVLYGMVSPFAEEVVFRGIIYNRMKKIWERFQGGRPASVIVPMILSSLLFGVYHGNIVQMLYGFLMGMLIVYVYEKCGSFLYAVLFHGIANVIVYVITGSPFLYEYFMKPYIGFVLAGIAVMAAWLLGRIRNG